jgi:hypothetical protein
MYPVMNMMCPALASHVSTVAVVFDFNWSTMMMASTSVFQRLVTRPSQQGGSVTSATGMLMPVCEEHRKSFNLKTKKTHFKMKIESFFCFFYFIDFNMTKQSANATKKSFRQCKNAIAKTSIVGKTKTKKNKTSTKCRNWIVCPFEEAADYALPPVIHCNNCKRISKMLHLVHGTICCDYVCYKCNQDVDVTYFCLYCRNNRNNRNNDEDN